LAEDGPVGAIVPSMWTTPTTFPKAPHWKPMADVKKSKQMMPNRTGPPKSKS
jgi:hypothetical protein